MTKLTIKRAREHAKWLSLVILDGYDDDGSLNVINMLISELEITRNHVTGPSQEPDPLLSDFAKALEENRESIPVAIMEHFDQLQKQVDYSRGGKLGPRLIDAPNFNWQSTTDHAGFECYFLDFLGHVIFVEQVAEGWIVPDPPNWIDVGGEHKSSKEVRDLVEAALIKAIKGDAND